MVNGSKVEDRLDSSLDFPSWKFRVFTALKENDLLDYVNFDVVEPSEDVERTQ